MNDYLNNLVERTLKIAPVVQPRLASLFESGSTAAGVINRGPSEVERQGNDPSVATSRAPDSVLAEPIPSQTGTLVRENIAVDMFDRKNGDPDRNRESQKTSTAFKVTHHLPAEPAAGGSIAPVAGRTASRESEVEKNHQRADERPTAPATASASGRSLIIERDREENWPRLQPRIRQLLDQELAHLRPARRVGDERKAREQNKAVAASTGRVNDARIDASQIKPAPHILREPIAITETAPPINVTIGRIDVRAIVSQPSQTPPVPRPRPSTTSSLDEYLRKRSEGRQ